MPNQDNPLGHDPDYLSRREAQERLAAEQSVDLAARRVHEVLANRYAERLRTAPPPVV